MSSERWQRIEGLYLSALEYDEPQRSAMLDEACAGDADLRREVDSLLAQEPYLLDFLETTADHATGVSSGVSEADWAAPPLDEAGLFAGRYRIVRTLGRGGMGVVYQAEDIRLKRFVALKFFGASLSAPEARARFLREAQAAAALDDPHVCTLYEASEEGGRAYLAMAFIDGTTLKDRIASGPLPVDQVVTIARNIAAGLGAAHARGIVHRDIKPGNVLLPARGPAKITDFGVARIDGGTYSAATGTVLGTPPYMSPEQIQGLPTDYRSDIWSLGCVIHEMLTGRSPFLTASGQTDVFAIVRGPAPSVAAVRPEAPPALVAIVERCLQPDLRCRYQDAASVGADLEALGRGSAMGLAARDDLPSIAVLPFADMSADRTQEYLAEGIAEEMINALARIEGIRVVARTSSFAVQGRGFDVREIGRVLNVGSVLEGSVRASGNRLRITAQLINVADGFHVWSERFDREAGDIFAVQDEITASIVDRLAVALGLNERAALRKRGRVDPQAYALYLKGRYFANRISPDTVEPALRCFGDALVRDPHFAPAYAGIATLWGDLASFNLAPVGEAWPRARAAAEQALALDPDVPDAHVVCGGMAMWYDWDWTAAEAALTRAVALSPGDGATRGRYAWLLLNRRRFDECCAAIRQALAADPLSPILYAFSIGLHAACGRGQEALEEFRRAVELAPHFGLSYFHAGVAYLSLGRLEDAASVVEEGQRQGLTVFWADCIVGMARARQGRREEAVAVMKRMIDQQEAMNLSCASIAWVAACLGDFDTAFAWFDRGYAERDGLLASVHVYTDIFVPALGRDPRYRALLERMRLADVVAPLHART